MGGPLLNMQNPKKLTETHDIYTNKSSNSSAWTGFFGKDDPLLPPLQMHLLKTGNDAIEITTKKNILFSYSKVEKYDIEEKEKKKKKSFFLFGRGIENPDWLPLKNNDLKSSVRLLEKRWIIPSTMFERLTRQKRDRAKKSRKQLIHV